MGPPVNHAAFRPGSGVFERISHDSLKELNTSSERLTSIHDSGINPSFRGARVRANPESGAIAKCLDSGSAPKTAHPGMTEF
jgi:hypothetical protein